MPELPSEESTLDALHALKDTLSLIQPEQFHPIRVSHANAWERTATLYTQAEALLPLLDKEYSPERAQAIREAHADLLRYARAFYAAEAQLEAAARPGLRAKNPVMTALTSELRQMRKHLFKWAERCLEDHPIEGPTLLEIRAKRSAQDLQTDLTGLVAIFRRRWDELRESQWHQLLESKGITSHYLDLAAQRVTRWLDLKVMRPNSRENRLLRQQAFTALFERYELVLKAGRHLLPKLKWIALNSTRAS